MKSCPFCAEAIQDAAVVCRFCGRELAERSPSGSRLSRVLRGAELGLGITAGGLVALLLFSHLQPARGDSRATAEPPPAEDAGSAWVEEARAGPDAGYLSLPVLRDAALRLSAGEAHESAFTLDDPRACTLAGEVRVTGGGNRDIDILLLDEAGHRQWRSGREPAPVFSDRRATETSLYAPLPGPGSYVLVLSNRFSLFTAKSVKVENVRVLCP